MLRKIASYLFALLFLVGLGVLTYPTISNQWNTYRQNQLISTYQETVAAMTPEDFSTEWEQANALNATITENNIYGDVFGEDEEDNEMSAYRQALNIRGDGIMGYLTIPKINVKLSIYHGTADSVLQTGVGHLNGTSLPIGGKGTHSVLAAHRGLPSSKLFTDVDQLEEGDVFYIKVLDETLAYQVDQILPMVESTDMDTLSEALAIDDNEDYVSLFTCTPYGVNTHRLIVRGTRIPYEPTEITDDNTPAGVVVEAVKDYYMLYLIAGLVVALILILLLRLIFRRKRNKGVKEDS
ncbi:MAG: class C sortase [Lachnospiraceae bacterium]|nr:class C sortase [Lachnospiraceae bacterium]MDD6505753.1 class C sortase [Lachnospiraceae bacterium]